MPPLSAYTPLESLLFFQSLAVFDTRPASFVSISDLLRNNKFVRENVAFDAHRLSPEALEELYTTLMRDGVSSSGVASAHEPNGHHLESSGPNNPKKRKIASPRPEGLSDVGKPHAALVPGLVAHLYARYKELVTREIKNDEKRFIEIREEIERLQKEDRDVAAGKSTVPIPTPVSHAKHEPAPEPMDLDTNEKPVEQPRPPKEIGPAPVEPPASIGARQAQLEPQRKDLNTAKQQTTVVPPQPVTPQLQQPPTRAVAQQPQTQTINLQPQLQPPPQSQAFSEQPSQRPLQQPPPQLPQQQQLQPQPSPSVRSQQGPPGLSPQPQPPNGNVIPTSQQPGLAPRHPPVQEGLGNVPPRQPQKAPAAPVAVAPGAGPGRGPVGMPLQASQSVNVPVPSPPQKAAQTSRAAGRKGPPIAPLPTPSQRLPPQPSFQQWSLNQPQTPQPAHSFSIPAPAGHVAPIRPSPAQQTPKPENRVQQTPQPVSVPFTPQTNPSAFQSPAPSAHESGFATPIGSIQGLPFTGQRSSRPRLSITTPGSLTPWKQTPHLTLPRSPRSPERPRSEDVSPISERAPSPFGPREPTPDEPEPPRRKRRTDAKGPGREREKGTEVAKGRPKQKGEKATGTVGWKRDGSAASSRSRGRSVLSRDDESGPESGKIKREPRSTPAEMVDSADVERTSAGQKGAITESRPGRGRPKRKRAPSEAAETEPPQPELSQLSRVDPTQSTPYVLCTRNFPRTGAPIMNDVTTHKHASIFTKPLTERDAPGYRDLIYRPQDLKSIKSSIHQGSKALAAATEAANTPAADGESPAPNAGTPSKNAVLMLQKTEDVIPPKAIVNSAQLEKELIRMFANAVMFNPIPQRGFGPAFPMSGDGGSRARSYAPEPEEGGIIKDTLEMFEDVEQAVTRWRAAERTADELASKSILSLRRESASDPSTESADDVKG